MTELIDLCWVILGLVTLYYGAEYLVKGSSELALSMGISPLVVGLTVVAFGTSAPELVVSVKANLEGNGGMAIGNVVGSNICNIALILGFSSVIFPLQIHQQVIRRELPILAAVTLFFAWMIQDGIISRLEGAILFIGVILYVFSSLKAATREPVELPHPEGEGPLDKTPDSQARGKRELFLNLLLILGGCILLVFGADRMVYGGANIARSFGVSEAVIGLTLFAFGTSLPELATSIVAALKKQGDLIVGNAVGSCIFNILAVVGMTGIIADLAATGINSVHVTVMIVTSLIILPMMWHRMVLDRWEGVILTLGYLCFSTWLIYG